MSIARRSAVVMALTVIAIPTGVADAHHSRPTVRVVHPGQSIQAALNAARPGDTVVVRRGTYRENVEILTDRITLIGQGAVLEAPEPSTVRSHCPGPAGQNLYGICVVGEADLNNGTVVREIHGVTVRGFTVGRFPSTGIVVFGGNGTRLTDLDVAGGFDYAILLARSTRSSLTDSQAHGARTAGLYIGDSPQSRAFVRGNRMFDNGIFGIFVRDAAHGTILGNQVEGSCIGLGFVPTRQTPRIVADWYAGRNRIARNTKLCGTGDPARPLTGMGVFISGSSEEITVAHNRVENNQIAAGSNAPWGGGVVLVNGAQFGVPAAPAHNRIIANRLSGNLPNDIMVVHDGSDNRIQANRCATSSPAGLCR